MDDHSMENVKSKRTKRKKGPFSEEQQQRFKERKPERKFFRGLKAFRKAYGPPQSGDAKPGDAQSSDAQSGDIHSGPCLFPFAPVDSAVISQPTQQNRRSYHRHKGETREAAMEREPKRMKREAENMHGKEDEEVMPSEGRDMQGEQAATPSKAKEPGEGDIMDVEDERADGSADNYENPSDTKESYKRRYRSESPEVRVRTWKEMGFQTGRWKGTFDA